MTQAAESGLPDRREFWQWVWGAVRPVVGWVLALLGVVALVVGWYGVSGQALTAKQLPYLVSAGLTGIALFIMAGVFLATDDVRRQFDRIGELERKVDDLYSLFVTELADARTPVTSSPRPAPSDPASEVLVAVPNGTSYHRPGCSLVAGKPDAKSVDARAVKRRRLHPCRVCEPPSAA